MKRCPTCGRRETRSSEANRRYFALVTLVSQKVPDENGVYHGVKAWHLFFKEMFLGYEDVALPDGRVVSQLKSSRQDTPEFAEYMAQVEAWAANEHDIYLPE